MAKIWIVIPLNYIEITVTKHNYLLILKYITETLKHNDIEIWM